MGHDQLKHGERIWDIPPSRQDRDTIVMEDEEVDRTVTAGQADITSMVCNLSKRHSAADVDLDIFDVSPLEYHNFMTLFHELVEKRIDDPRGRLTRLIRYHQLVIEMVRNFWTRSMETLTILWVFIE